MNREQPIQNAANEDYLAEPYPCRSCGTVGRAHWGEHYNQTLERVQWSCSFRCAKCNGGFEADGGEPPAEVRAELIAVEGLWKLRLCSLGEKPFHVLSWIRTTFGFQPREARTKLDQLTCGTKNEMQLHCDQVRALGASADVGEVVKGIMSAAYLRTLGTSLRGTFQRLASANPDRWSEELRIAEEFLALTQVGEEQWAKGAEQLLLKAEPRLRNPKTAMEEMVLALRAMRERVLA